MSFTMVTVSQLNRYVKTVLEEQKSLEELYVKGEIASLSRPTQSGHLYFTLKEGAASVRAVMFRDYARGVPFEPQAGLRIIVRCTATLYERDGQFQLMVYDMQPDGLGAAHLALEQRKERLRQEGLFDQARKRPLPPAPTRIGVVTSAGGAVLHDILSVLGRRWPLATVVLSPAAVQGENAPAQLTAALLALDKAGGCQVILLARGGGDAKDLEAFNDEGLARAVAACRVPVVSAVGHETDFTLCDLAADLRAPTPSAAAELVAPDVEEIRDRLEAAVFALEMSMQTVMEARKATLTSLEQKLLRNSPQKIHQRNGQRLDFLVRLLTNAYKDALGRKISAVNSLTAALSRLNPAAVLQRGYSITMRDGALVVSAGELGPGDLLTTRLGDGMVRSTVTEILAEGEGAP